MHYTESMVHARIHVRRCMQSYRQSTLLAATTTVGHSSMTSRAKEGPDRNTAGCFLWSALGMISDIICPVDTSSPLLTLMIGRSGGSMPCDHQALAADHQCTMQQDQRFLKCWYNLRTP